MLRRDSRHAITAGRSISPLRRRTGDRAEAAVAGQLAALGWTILAAGVRVGRDELDLVAIEPGIPPTLVFVEVRSRTSERFGAPEETTGADKIARTYRAAFALLRERCLPDGRPLPPLRWRVDLVSVDARPLRRDELSGVALRHLRGVAPD
jgi:putative endonuclease